PAEIRMIVVTVHALVLDRDTVHPQLLVTDLDRPEPDRLPLDLANLAIRPCMAKQQRVAMRRLARPQLRRIDRDRCRAALDRRRPDLAALGPEQDGLNRSTAFAPQLDVDLQRRAGKILC